MAKVQLRGLTKRFEDTVAVDNLDLEVNDGEFVVLLGPSGCGKTTTLRMIAGLESKTEGGIYIGDREVSDLDPQERNIAMVFQSYALYPHMTVFKNMAFPLENAKVPEGEIVKRVNKTAKLLQIEKLLGRKPVQLSGGQRQRVALGRALVREPLVFLMDEPLSNLDAKLRVHMRAELKRLQKDIGVTTIYVTHDQIEAMTMANRIALLEGGKIQQYASPKEMYNHPANRFVAGFIGSPPINQIECDLADGVLDAHDFQIPIPMAYADVLGKASSKLVIGIRPQDVQIRLAHEADDLIRARVYTTEPLGDSMIVDLELGDHIVKAIVNPDFELADRDELWVLFPARKIHLFDQTTGIAVP